MEIKLKSSDADLVVILPNGIRISIGGDQEIGAIALNGLVDIHTISEKNSTMDEDIIQYHGSAYDVVRRKITKTFRLAIKK